MRFSFGGALAAVAAAVLLAAPAANAATFTVNDSGDAPDALADGLCLTAGGQCTLRAAVEEANRTVTGDDVGVAASVTAPIALGSALTISQPLDLDGCSADPGHLGACVQVTATGELLIDAGDTTVQGLDWLGPAAIHFADGRSGLTLRNNWFGIDLAGQLQHDLGAAVLIEGDSAEIGGEDEADRNVFAWNEIAVRIDGGDDAVVWGNYFGLRPSGADGGSGVYGIAVTRGGDADVPVGTFIGAQLDAGALATPECDGACNAFASVQHAIDLDPAIGNGPAGTTTIAGNQIGIVDYVPGGIHAGSASDVLVGGSEDGDRNRFGYCYDGVFAEDPDGLAVVNNSFGLAPDGTQLDNTCVEAAVKLEGDLSTTLVADNEIAGMGTLGSGNMPAIGVLLLGDEATVVGNEIGAGTSEPPRFFDSAVHIEGDANLIGGDDPADANILRGGHGAGVQILGGSYNAVLGNTVDDSDGPALLVDRLPDEEVIGNLLVPNVGTGNDGPFIELSGDPHDGIQPPAIVGGGADHAAGTGQPGAEITVLERAAGGAAGDIDAAVGTATVASDGRWSATLSGATPGALLVAAQTGDEGTSELSDPVTVGPGGDSTAPETTIVHPGNYASAKTRTYTLSSTEPGVYECRWDGGHWAACPAGGPLPQMADGGHKLEAAAVDAAGNIDPSPAVRLFTLDTVAPQTVFGPLKLPVLAGLPTTFNFTSEPGTTFRCVVDGVARPCTSPLVLVLDAGRHRVEVAATDRAGNADPSPDVQTFTAVDPASVSPPTIVQTLRADLTPIAARLAKLGLRGLLTHPRGVVLRGVEAPGPGTLSLRARAGKVLVLSGLQKVRRAGKVGLRVKPTRAGRKLMRGRSRKLAVTIELSFSRADGTRRKATRRVVLRPR